MTFLDAHMECGEGWLQPTLARIADDRSVVAVPLLGSVSSGDMGYSGPSSMEITALRWHLVFNWFAQKFLSLTSITNFLFYHR